MSIYRAHPNSKAPNSKTPNSAAPELASTSTSISNSTDHETRERPAAPRRPIRRPTLTTVKPEPLMPTTQEASSAPETTPAPIDPEVPQAPAGKALDVEAQMVDPAAAIAKELLTDWRYDC